MSRTGSVCPAHIAVCHCKRVMAKRVPQHQCVGSKSRSPCSEAVAQIMYPEVSNAARLSYTFPRVTLARSRKGPGSKNIWDCPLTFAALNERHSLR